MPGYVIHLAVGNEYLRKNIIKDKDSFLNGIIAPDILKAKFEQENKDMLKSELDILKYKESHLYNVSGIPDFKKFILENDINEPYYLGYFIHLLTDYLMYKFYLKDELNSDFNKNLLYDDYDILNRDLIDKYNIELQDEITKEVKFKSGNLTYFNMDGIINFIEYISNVDAFKYVSDVDYKNKFDEEINKN